MGSRVDHGCPVTIIYIPSRGRLVKQPTYDTLVDSGFDVVIVCPPEEVRSHESKRRAALACPVQGIMATRQWIVDNATDRKVLMFDDDLRFAERTLANPGRFVNADARSVRTMLLRLEALLDQVPLAGLGNRGGANRVEPHNIPVAMNKRLFDVHCLDTEWFHREGIRYRQEFMEDFDVSLQAHLKGYPSALLTTHTKDNIGGANAGGGCSMYRTLDRQARAARQLAATWPGFVSIREVQAKSKGEWSTRIDVKVKWVEAFKAGVELRDLLGIPQHPAPDWEGLAPEWTLL